MNEKAFFHKLFGTTRGEGMQPKEAIAYSITGIGQNFICSIIGSFLMVFMTDVLGFDNDVNIGAVTGVVAVAWLMLGTRIFDALNDPIMGSIVDRTRTKWGKCRPYLKWMAIPIGLITVACFLPFYQATVGGFIALSIVYVIWSVLYTVADVPYWGLSTALTNDTIVRGKLLTVARLACTAGAGIVTVFVPVIMSAVTAKFKYPAGTIINGVESGGLLDPQYAAQNAQTLKWAYLIVTVVLVVLSIPMFFYGLSTRRRFTATDTPPSLGHNMKLLIKNKQLMLIVASVFWARRECLYLHGGLYFCKYALANESAYATLTLLIIPGGLSRLCLCRGLLPNLAKMDLFATHILGAVAMIIMYFIGISIRRLQGGRFGGQRGLYDSFGYSSRYFKHYDVRYDW